MNGSNPYVVVGSPNYAIPIVNFMQQGQQGQQQRQGQQGQQGQQQPGPWAQFIQRMLAGQQQQQAPGAPMNINPNNGPVGVPTVNPTQANFNTQNAAGLY
jgi:hypothetical protein